MNFENLKRTLLINRNKQFVKRILNRSMYAPLDLGEDDNGKRITATHRMEWGAGGKGQYYVYPTIAENHKGKLTQFSSEEAWQRAKVTGDYIRFDDREDADWFSKNYKQYWGNQTEERNEEELPDKVYATGITEEQGERGERDTRGEGSEVQES